MAAPSITNTFVSNTVATAAAMNQNFTDIVSGLSSGSTWDVVTSSLTTGAASLNGAVTINDSGANVDFRVEGDTDQNLLFCDASSDRLMIGTNAGNAKFNVKSSSLDSWVTQYVASDNSILGGFYETSNGYSRFSLYDSGGINVITQLSSDISGDTYPIKTDTGTDNCTVFVEMGPASSSDFARFMAKCTGNSQQRYAQLGVVYLDQSSSGGSNAPCAYLSLQEGDGGYRYLWSDNSGNLRISSFDTQIGSTSGTVVGTQTSDERTKQNIKPISYGLDTVMSLEPLEFDQFGDHKLGFTAQRTKSILSESVFDTKEDIDGTENTKLGMDYIQIIPVLVKAIQELKQEINLLRGK